MRPSVVGRASVGLTMPENKIITLNVGGSIFQTTWSTLQTIPCSLLAELTNPHIPFDLVTNDHEYCWSKLQKEKSASKLVEKTRAERKDVVFQNARFSREARISSICDAANVKNEPERNNIDLQGLPWDEERSRSYFIFVVDQNSTSAKSLNTCTDITRETSNSLIHTTAKTPSESPEPPPSKQAPRTGLNSSPASNLLLNKSNTTQELFFDRNPFLLPYVLDAYRLGLLHLPAEMCSVSIREELHFWKIPEAMISDCCWKNFYGGIGTVQVVDTINNSLEDQFDDQNERDKLTFLGRIWLTMERPSYNMAAKVWCAIYFIMITLSLVLFTLFTVSDLNEVKPEFRDFYNYWTSGNRTIQTAHLMMSFQSVLPVVILEYILRAFFTSEFIVRLVCCPDKNTFIRNGHNITDLVINTMVWVRWVVDICITKYSKEYSMALGYFLMAVNCTMVLVALRVFHMAKYLREFKIIYLCAKASIRELLLLVAIMTSAVMIFGTLIFVVEAMESPPGQPLVYRNVPMGMWWAIITMTTVGYGDIYPTTTGGYLVGSMCAVIGLILVALPVAVLASNFSTFYENLTSHDQRKRREFLMTHIQRLLSGNRGDEDGGGGASGDGSSAGKIENALFVDRSKKVSGNQMRSEDLLANDDIMEDWCNNRVAVQVSDLTKHSQNQEISDSNATNGPKGTLRGRQQLEL